MGDRSREEQPALLVSTEVGYVPSPASYPVLPPRRRAKWPKTYARTRVTP